MVKVTVDSKENQIVRINVTGHAEYSEAGQDLVCAAVSSITFGMMNALEELAEGTCSFTVDEANVNIQQEIKNEVANCLLEAMVVQFLTIEENYQSYIKIIRQEV